MRRGICRKIRGQLLQSFRFVLDDVAALILREAEHENPSAPLVRGDQRAKAATLSLSRSLGPLLEQAATKVGVIQPDRHLAHGGAETERRLDHPVFLNPAAIPLIEM